MVKVESTEFSEMHNMSILLNPYLCEIMINIMPCVLNIMFACNNAMNASLSTCINHRQNMYINHNRAKTASPPYVR